MQYFTDIGLEVHVELSTRTKMFCGCPVVDPTVAQPNTAVCPVCLGMPGTLPVVNKQAVAFAIKAGLALHCQVAERSIFARKNYFYPDLPKGFQISQYELPITYEGWINIHTSQGEKNIRIRRAHLEEDTGKLNHYNNQGEPYSLVDLNRAGIPLLEIVSEPDMHTIEEVRAYSQELRLLLRYLEITSGDMEKGAMRFEANVSMRASEKDALGTRVEIKNLNSIHAMEKAIAYELDRQQKILEKGGSILQETLGWNETRSETFSQRSKEEAHDYRYFPEPDLPPLIVEKSWIETIASEIPELPGQKRDRYKNELNLPVEKLESLIQDKSVSIYFDETLKLAEGISANTIANWILGDLFSWMNESGCSMYDIKVSPAELVNLIQIHQQNVINKNSAKEILREMLQNGKSAQEIVREKSLEQITSFDELEKTISQILQEYPDEVASYHAGKETLFNWLFGQVMQSTRGKADPQKVQEILKKALSK
ncbi:MAG: Asp-tRNA(Asn)/Glu-tRNA(Gln) amidotransferase subunit GatB [Anaerolineaceae bacterium]|jgi:aspartyl-tRNA(Asn)/glutamyl-tRNA(Gln) amidotransferase subunit B|nr:MAG: Asp-tRNA(Asn)/Glu-tRNA(Gln) amidotransferase subunit GatB [Anaerolineaceae bacterium]